MTLAVVIFFLTKNSEGGIYIGETEKNANQVSKTEQVPGIHSIKAEGIINVSISKGDKEEVRYEFPAGRYKNKSTFQDGVLNIDFKSARKGFSLFSWPNSSTIKAIVTVNSLKWIQMEGVGSVQTTNTIDADELKIRNDGTGKMEIAVNGTFIDARNEGVGSLTVSGSADQAELINEGVGSIDAEQFVVQKLEARNAGVGSMDVYAEEEISLRNTGVGRIEFSGDARITEKTSEGVGRISKK